MYSIKKENLYLLSIVFFLAIISLLIIKSFLVPIIFTGILVYLFHPIYDKLIKKLKSHVLTSFLMIAVIGIILIVPATLSLWNLSQELNVLHDNDITQSLDNLTININQRYNTNINLTQEYEDSIVSINDYVRENVINKIPQAIFEIFIIMFFFYYFQKNYKNESDYLRIIFGRKRIKEIAKNIKKLIDGIIYGQILVRFIQAFIGTIFFIILGINGAILWGFIMFFAAFIPIFGTGLVWGPIIIINILNNNYITAFLVLLVGIFVSTIDNLLLPHIISGKTNIGPVITLISIIGGIEFFGIYGIILGPFFLGLLLVLLEELFYKLRTDIPRIKRYVWTPEERKKFYGLKSSVAREEFIRILHKKYAREEAQGYNVNYRYVVEEDEK